MIEHRSRRPLVLILEDEAVVALNLQDEFEEAGYRVAGPFTTCADARSWLDSDEPDAAVLDTALKDGSCREIALELARRSVPFLIYSGHRQDRDLLGEFDRVTWIEKPVPPSVLVEEFRQLLPKAA